MATIVQNYNPWREQLAANLLTPLIGDMIKRSQEANMNAKYNSLYNTVMSSVSGEQQTQPDVNLLSTPTTPEGYNNDGWAKSFHNDYTPFTQFDIWTQSLMGQPVNRAMQTPQDIITALGEQIGTPRYNMLNYANAYKMLEPAIKLAEQNRLQERTNSVITALGNATTPQEQFNTLLVGLARGDITNETMEAWRKNNEFNNPHSQPVQINAGDEVYLAGYNPKNQEYSMSGSVPVGLSPSQVSDIALRTRGYDIQERKNAQDYISDQNDYSLEQDKLTETNRHNTALEEIAGLRAKNTANKTWNKPSWGVQQQYKRVANDNKELEKRLLKSGEKIKKLQERLEHLKVWDTPERIKECQMELDAEMVNNKNIQERIYNNDAVIEAMEERYGFSQSGNTQQNEYTPLGDNNNMLPPVSQQYRPNADIPEVSNQAQSFPTPLGNVTSNDIRPRSEDIQGNGSNIQETGQEITVKVPRSFVYQDSDAQAVPPNKRLTAQQLHEYIEHGLEKYKGATADGIIQALYEEGFRVIR